MKKPTNSGIDSLGEMNSVRNDIGEKSGFQTSGYINKKGTPYGEGVMFNKMPPGMDIGNQDICDINNMPMKKLTDLDYPGDGAFAHRDIPE